MADESTNKKVKLTPRQWVEKHGDYLYNYAYSRVQSKETAEDLVQETFVSAIRAVDSFRGDSNEITWLIAILKRKIIDYYRKQSRKKETAISHFNTPFNNEGHLTGHWINERVPKNWDVKYSDPMRQTEFIFILEMCLSALPAKWKTVFVLKVMEELKTEQVCKEVGIKPSNVWVILHRAKLQLRECIEKRWLK
ncbi:MAG: sigma-70 family RNA polymerase sigma factor [Chlorobi bacterium]|nr:sigma-70 family RNA polymerase sigma factor [Chlorobiota bacterium]